MGIDDAHAPLKIAMSDMERYPPSMHEEKLFFSEDFNFLRGRRTYVYSGYLRKIKTRLGFMNSHEDGNHEWSLLEKSGTAIVVYVRGIPVIRGYGGRRPNGMFVNELRRIWNEHLVSERLSS